MHRNFRGNGHKQHFRPRRRYTLFQRMSYFARKHPISLGVILILASIVLFRLSFTNVFLHSSEVFMWSMLVSALLFIAGLLVLKGYWKNNVSNFNSQHNFNWK